MHECQHAHLLMHYTALAAVSEGARTLVAVAKILQALVNGTLQRDSSNSDVTDFAYRNFQRFAFRHENEHAYTHACTHSHKLVSVCSLMHACLMHAI